MAGVIHDVITCAKFQTEIFTGYDFTGGGRIFDFPININFRVGYSSAPLPVITRFHEDIKLLSSYTTVYRSYSMS